jgi:carbonic anhydrase/acetyltransferase-like protein (isoleucine patch superfamily)
MAIETYEEFSPTLASDVFVAASADVIGRVTLKEQASIWYNATLRGDINEIVVGSHSNVQDNAVLHLSDDLPCIIGDYVTVGHSAIVHAATVEDGVLVGMGSIILDGSVIGENSIVGAGALVTGSTIVPPNSLVLGSPAKVVRALKPEEVSAGRDLAEKYVRQSRKFLARNRDSA